MTDAVTVDARGTRCPMQIHLLSRAIDRTAEGTIVLLADDPNARVDVPVWCRLRHHELTEISQTHGAWRFVLELG